MEILIHGKKAFILKRVPVWPQYLITRYSLYFQTDILPLYLIHAALLSSEPKHHKLARYSNVHIVISLQWCHNGRDGVSNLQPRDCLLNCLFRRRSKKTSNLRVTGLCVGNSPVTGEFLAQRASNAENASIWWRHHVSDLMPKGRNSIDKIR